MENMDIRLLAKGAGVPLWRIAKELKVSEPTMTRIMREPLDEKTEDRIKAAIAKLRVN